MLRAGLPPTGAGRGGGRGGRGSRKPQGSGRSGLLALLRAVEENDGSSGAGDGMDWAAGAGDEELDAGRYDRNGDRARRGRGKRPRYAEYSAGDVYSDSYSVDSADDSRRDAGRWDVTRSDESDRQLDEEEQMPQKRRQRAGWRHGRIRRTNDENYFYGDEALDRVAGELAQKQAQQQKKKPVHKPARAPSPAGGPQGPRRHRCVAGANQWVTEDGLIVWPKVGAVDRDGCAEFEQCVDSCNAHALDQSAAVEALP